jgi:2-polyprenyl-3-methyl-5-hydroxy-6-metoxy-1,4-benzoquinol methylase
MSSKLQQQFFDKSKHQYAPHFIVKPPLHTTLEIEAITSALKRIPKNAEIMDFGAGSGRITIPLLLKKFSVLAIDVSNTSLKNLQHVADELKLPKPGIARVIPKDKTFSAITGADILHHVDLDTYLPLFYKSLKKGGIAVFSEPCAFNLAWYAYLPFASSWEVEKGMTQCTYFNLQKKFKKHGFTYIKIRGFGLFPTPLFAWSRKLCRINDALGDLPFCKLFAYRYIIEARKG